MTASRAERRAEARSSAGLTAPEGSAAREAAERSPVSTTSTTVSAAPALAVTTLTPTTLREGSPAREAAERAARAAGAGSTTTPPTEATTSSTAGALTATTVAPQPASARPSTETLFGLHTESAAATATGATLLLAGALLVVVARQRRVLAGVAALGVALALLDGREAMHQHHEARPGLVAAALALAVLHLAAAGLALVLYRREGTRVQ